MALEIQRRGFDRLVNLSDAVIAIAATLLILPLVESAGDLGAGSLADFLTNSLPKLFVFILSFVVIARFWVVHHAMYRAIDGYTTPLLWLNFVWLISIVFLPFPTELNATASDDSNQLASVLYIGTLTLTAWSGLAQQLVIVRTPDLQLESVRGTPTTVPAAVAAVIFAVALIITIAVPGVNQWPLLLLLLSGLFERLLLRRGRGQQKSEEPTAGGSALRS